MAQKKEYRSAVRSRRMIREAFIDLLGEKEFSKITVTDIVRRADLNRSTFYAHYPDVRGVVEEIQTELLEKGMALLEGERLRNIMEDPLPYLGEISKMLEENLTIYRLVGNTLDVRLFLDAFRKQMAEGIRNHAEIPEEIRNSPDVVTTIHFMAGGIMNAYQQWAEGNMDCTLEELTQSMAELIRKTTQTAREKMGQDKVPASVGF